ncbi:hypothetical protein D3C80_1554180 [compost metagenome]
MNGNKEIRMQIVCHCGTFLQFKEGIIAAGQHHVNVTFFFKQFSRFKNNGQIKVLFIFPRNAYSS